MENNHLFSKKVYMCLVLLCKMIDQNLKFFRIKKKLNTPI